MGWKEGRTIKNNGRQWKEKKVEGGEEERRRSRNNPKGEPITTTDLIPSPDRQKHSKHNNT